MSAADLPLCAAGWKGRTCANGGASRKRNIGYVRDMIEGRDTTRPFIFSVDGGPTGYLQYWFIGDHQNATWIADHPWLAELPSDAVGVDLSIGDPGRLSRGIGSAVLRAFARPPRRRRLPDDHHRPRSGQQACRAGL